MKLILRYGEIYLKGDNQKLFKNLLTKNIKQALKGIEYNLEVLWSRYLLQINDCDCEEVKKRIKKVFGLVSLSVANEVEASVDAIKQFCSNLKIEEKTFRVNVNRADKNFPITSVEMEKLLGEIILENNPNLKVKLKNAEVEINVDIRENLKAYIFTKTEKCAGGLPLGSSGKGLLLLSGGIDSPVAGYMMAKRGLRFECLHFHSYPYTGMQARQKVMDLCEKISKFHPNLTLNIVSVTEIQEEIHKHCQDEYMITILRRFMYRIAERLCNQKRLGAIITGENLGQVASQTMESLTSSNSVLQNKIAFRPLLAYDKSDIIKVSEEIGTYETSILPYEDCCTVFLPKYPLIKPKLEKVLKEEAKLDVEGLVQRSMQTIEVFKF